MPSADMNSTNFLSNSTDDNQSEHNSSTESLNLLWMSYLQSHDFSHASTDSCLNNADDEKIFSNYFGTFNIDDTSTLKKIHHTYNKELIKTADVSNVKEQAAEAKLTLKIITTFTLCEQFMNIYAIKLCAAWHRKISNSLYIIISADKSADFFFFHNDQLILS